MPIGEQVKTGYSDFDQKQVEVFYGEEGPGPLPAGIHAKARRPEARPAARGRRLARFLAAALNSSYEQLPVTEPIREGVSRNRAIPSKTSRGGGKHHRLADGQPTLRQIHRACRAPLRFPSKPPLFFASKSNLESDPHVLGHVVENLLMASLRRSCSGTSRHSFRLAGLPRACAALSGATGKAAIAKHVEHHVHVVDRQFPAFIAAARLLPKHIEIESQPVPRQ